MKIPIELEGEYLIRLVDLPVYSDGFVVYDDEDFANVYLNARHNYEKQHESADHEMKHVIHDDIHSDEDIRAVEARADGIPKALRSIPRLMRASDLLPKTFTPAPRRRLNLGPGRQVKSQWDNDEGVTMDMFIGFKYVHDGEDGYYIPLAD